MAAIDTIITLITMGEKILLWIKKYGNFRQLDIHISTTQNGDRRLLQLYNLNGEDLIDFECQMTWDDAVDGMQSRRVSFYNYDDGFVYETPKFITVLEAGMKKYATMYPTNSVNKEFEISVQAKGVKSKKRFCKKLIIKTANSIL